MTDLKEVANQIALLQEYSFSTGVKTSRSQADILRPLNGSDTVKVLELVRDMAREKAGR
jgi:hypothetical protein